MEKIKENIIQKNSTDKIDDSIFNVVMYNDDITPFEYVIMVLQGIFNIPQRQGIAIAMNIHRNGQGVIASMSMKQAYKKLDEIDQMNDKYGYLLQANVERA